MRQQKNPDSLSSGTGVFPLLSNKDWKPNHLRTQLQLCMPRLQLSRSKETGKVYWQSSDELLLSCSWPLIRAGLGHRNS